MYCIMYYVQYVKQVLKIRAILQREEKYLNFIFDLEKKVNIERSRFN
jgi:hypothetical protein